MSKQLSLLPKSSKQHGGSLATGKRRSFRPLSPRRAHHITLKSHIATGGRCLLKHKKLIVAVMRKSSQLFGVKVYEHAVCGNHLHLVIKGPDRESIQNFFRVFAGHTAQKILKHCPLPAPRGGAPRSHSSSRSERLTPCRKNQRRFWSYLIYSRIISWGKEFKIVINYVQRNTLEALNIIAYKPRTAAKNKDTS